MPRKPRDPNIDSHAAAIARAAWEVPSDRYSVQFRARIPKVLVVEMSGQSPTEKGDTWADGWRIRQQLPLLIALVNQICEIENPSYIVDNDGVTVVWGRWQKTASTTVEAVLMVIQEMFPDGKPSSTKDL